ncbi:MAG: DMT family transporter [Rhodovibrionaceae bacterium]|nr:DMT family transporter [Rhodovibrionaceae bacterium]
MPRSLAANPQTAGILCIVTGMLALSANDAFMKFLSGDYALHQLVLMRSLVALTLVSTAASLTGGLASLKTRRLPLHIGRGLLLTLANSAYFLALAAMPLAEAVAVFFVAPLLITLLSVPFLGERVGVNRWFGVAVGLAGVVVMLRPGEEAISYASLLPLVAATAYATLQITTRRLGRTDRPLTMAFYIQLTFMIISLSMGLAAGDGRFAGTGDPSLDFLFRAWRIPDTGDLGLILACGVLIACAAVLLSRAYSMAQAAAVAPFEYVALPMAIVWGFVLWGDLPDGLTIVGILMIAGGGLFVLYREARKGREVASRHPLPRNR